jgi:hypothetical protein
MRGPASWRHPFHYRHWGKCWGGAPPASHRGRGPETASGFFIGHAAEHRRPEVYVHVQQAWDEVA